MPEGEGGEARGRLSCSRVISLWWLKDPMVLSHSCSGRAVIGTTRHLHLLIGWDPSGHAIVYGAQCTPLWYLWQAFELGHAVGCESFFGIVRTLMLVWLLGWVSVLCNLSGMTALAFHTLSETAASVTLVVGLGRGVAERARAWSCASRRRKVARRRRGARVAGAETAWSWLGRLCLCLCLVCSAI